MNDEEDINILTFKQLRQLVSKYNTHFRSGLLTSKNWTGKGAKDRLIEVVKREYTWERTGRRVRFILHLDPSTPVVYENVRLTAEAKKLHTYAPSRHTETMRHEEDLRALSVVRLRQLVVKYNKEAKGTLTSSRKATAKDWGDKDKLIEIIKANYSWKKEIDEELTIRRRGDPEEGDRPEFTKDYETLIGERGTTGRVRGDILKRADVGANRRYWNIYKMTFTLHGDPDNPEVFRGLTGGQGQAYIKLGATDYADRWVERHREWVDVPKKRLTGGGMRPYTKRELVWSKRAMGRGIKKVLDLTEEQMAVRMAEKHTQHTALEQRGLGYSLAEGSEIRERAREEARVEAKRVYDLPENVEKRRLELMMEKRRVVEQLMKKHREVRQKKEQHLTKLRELTTKRTKKIKAIEEQRVYNLPENVEKRRVEREEMDRRYQERRAKERAIYKAKYEAQRKERDRRHDIRLDDATKLVLEEGKSVIEALVEVRLLPSGQRRAGFWSKSRYSEIIKKYTKKIMERGALLKKSFVEDTRIAENKRIREKNILIRAKNKLIREKKERQRKRREIAKKRRERKKAEEEEWERAMEARGKIAIARRNKQKRDKAERERREKYGLE